MTKRTRRTHSPGFKAKAALASIRGEKMLAGLAKLLHVHPAQITAWGARVQEGGAGVFGACYLQHLAKHIAQPHEPWAAAFFAEAERILELLQAG